jgi:hypothetical protein
VINSSIAELFKNPVMFGFGKNSTFSQMLPDIDRELRKVKEDGTLSKIIENHQ